MDELIYKQPLLDTMDKRYNEKVNIVPDNLAEGFVQMEKLIKEQLVVTKQQIEEETINKFVATLLPRLTDAIYLKDVESMTNLIKGVAREVRGNDNEFFNYDSPVVNVDQKSYLKGYSQGLADKSKEMDKAKEEGYGKGVNDFAKTISPYISEYQQTIKQNRFAFIDVYGIAGRLVENYSNEHQQKDSKKRVINKCYARNCSNNNIDNTCMYGDKMTCQVNCQNCIHNCKKATGEKACIRFKRGKESVADE